MEFKSWQNVTVTQMAELLRTRLDGNCSGFWAKMRGGFVAKDKQEMNLQKQTGIPGTASSMVYLLTTAAAFQEKANGQEPSLEKLIADYHLDYIVNNPPRRSTTNSPTDFPEFTSYYYLSFIVSLNMPRKSNINELNKSLAEQCYDDQILPLVRDLVNTNPGEMILAALLDVLEEKNLSIKGQNSLAGPLQNLRDFLDKNWKSWVQADDDDKLIDLFNDLQSGPNRNPEPETAAAPQDAKPANPEKNSPELWQQIEGTFAESAVKRLNDGVRQIIFTGAPGTGKTCFAKLIARYQGGIQFWQKTPCAYTLVQFHPSYDYTDFVEGLRPVQLGENGRMAFVKLDGTFKAFCRSVLRYGDPEETYFFLIDEINRAELPKVFGELMYCLEADKRGEENRVQTQYQNLPAYELEGGVLRKIQDGEQGDVFAQGFYIPKNVCILGTMNDIDRSVESMDFALRRRFEWKSVEVTEEYLKKSLEKMGLPESEALSARTMALNQALLSQGDRYGLSKQYFIAQGQFANLPARQEWKPADLAGYVWDYRIEPLLREYLRGESEQNITEFLQACKSAFLPEQS